MPRLAARPGTTSVSNVGYVELVRRLAKLNRQYADVEDPDGRPPVRPAGSRRVWGGRKLSRSSLIWCASADLLFNLK